MYKKVTLKVPKGEQWLTMGVKDLTPVIMLSEYKDKPLLSQFRWM